MMTLHVFISNASCSSGQLVGWSTKYSPIQDRAFVLIGARRDFLGSAGRFPQRAGSVAGLYRVSSNQLAIS